MKKAVVFLIITGLLIFGNSIATFSQDDGVADENADTTALVQNDSTLTDSLTVDDDSTAAAVAESGGDEEASSDEQPAATSEDTAVAAEETDLEGSAVTWGIIILIFLTLTVLIRTYLQTRRTMDEFGMLGSKKYRKNHGTTFLFMAAIAALVIFLLKQGADSNSATLSTFLFGVFPYMVLAVFFIGTTFRYLNTGFKVSSLSSQFLEGKKLFFGSQPFHWGILILFFGHLIAFAVPKAVVLWNGHPVRLMILELCSFAFALLALVGLVLLMKRRFTNPRINIVSNKMDMFVYLILLIQILSGIGIAIFARWGSTWFATSITPYLRSIFTLDPQVDLAAAMPWYAQLHIVSAFLIIGIIPFSRFVHFLVVPIHYISRKYQVVYWNWNRKRIRKSQRHTYGKSPRNH